MRLLGFARRRLVQHLGVGSRVRPAHARFRSTLSAALKGARRRDGLDFCLDNNIHFTLSYKSLMLAMSPAHPLDPLTADEVCASPSSERAPPISTSDARSVLSRLDRSTPSPSQLESTPQRLSRSVPSSTSPSRSSRLQRGSFLRRSASLFRRAMLLCPSLWRRNSGGRPSRSTSTSLEAGECTRPS